jgi:hypothetical protein
MSFSSTWPLPPSLSLSLCPLLRSQMQRLLGRHGATTLRATLQLPAPGRRRSLHRSGHRPSLRRPDPLPVPDRHRSLRQWHLVGQHPLHSPWPEQDLCEGEAASAPGDLLPACSGGACGMGCGLRSIGRLIVDLIAWLPCSCLRWQDGCGSGVEAGWGRGVWWHQQMCWRVWVTRWVPVTHAGGGCGEIWDPTWVAGTGGGWFQP